MRIKQVQREETEKNTFSQHQRQRNAAKLCAHLYLIHLCLWSIVSEESGRYTTAHLHETHTLIHSHLHVGTPAVDK